MWGVKVLHIIIYIIYILLLLKFILSSTVLSCSFLLRYVYIFVLILYHYNINNDYAMYNNCNAWFLYIRRSTCFNMCTYVGLECVIRWYWFCCLFLQTKNDTDKTKWMATLLHLIQKDLDSPKVYWQAYSTVSYCYVLCSMLYISVQDLCTYISTCVCTLVDITLHWCYTCIYVLVLLYLSFAFVAAQFDCISFTQSTHVFPYVFDLAEEFGCTQQLYLIEAKFVHTNECHVCL